MPAFVFNRFRAYRHRSMVITVPVINRIRVECSILPSPTNGATIPPIRKAAAPSNAAALPRFSRADSRASVFPTGIRTPQENIMRNKTISNILKGHSVSNAHVVKTHVSKRNRLPGIKADC